MANATLVVGAMWGDEGKGKMIDILASRADLCLRAQGGHNAGHTIIADGVKYDFHIIPSGVTNPKCMNLIGSGCILHVPSFFKELEALKQKGLDYEDRLFISDRAHIDFDLHHAVDGLEEVELGKGSIGTTKKGIGPTFTSKVARHGVTLADMFDLVTLETRLRRMAVGYKKRYGDLLQYNVEEEISRFKEYSTLLAPFVIDEIPLLRSAKANHLNVVVEGAQATMLDITYGTYPFVTSSNCSVGGMLAGVALGWQSVKEVIGVVKAYTTRVGSGPFPTEQLNEFGEKLQQIGHEIGTTTGRKRRCGHLDLMVVRHSQEVNNWTSINLTKLDVLDTFEEIPVAISYSFEGQELESFPASQRILENVKVNYKVLPGWNAKTSGVRKYDELPENARKYIEFIEEVIGVKVKWIGTGPARDDVIER